MIREQHPFALQYVAPDTVRLLTDVVYESATDKPFDGVTFKTMTLIKKYMTKKGLQFEFIEP